MRVFAIAVLTWLFAAPLLQGPAELAETAFQAGEWEVAIEHLGALAAAGTLDGEGHYKLGYSHWRLGNCEQALLAYMGARESHDEHPRMLGTAAICAARLGRAAEALGDLDKALAVGAPPAVLLNDPSFEKYSTDARYESIAARYDGQLRPCMHDATARQFDFWVGDWDVYASGVVAGRNSITVEQDGCLLREEWTTGGTSGTSINFVDRAAGTWRQIWTDNAGNITHYEGNLVDGVMRFDGTSVALGGTTSTVRMSFIPHDDGSVRQLIEGTTDGGETWTISFDGRYVPRASS